MYHLTEAYLMAAFISALAAVWGAQFVAISAVPKLLRSTLDPEPHAQTMHAYWPGLFKLAMVWGLFATLVIACSVPFSAIPNIYGLLLTAIAGLMTLCYYGAWVMGQRQTAGGSYTASLPRSQTLFAVAALGTGLVLIAALVYVLPGQFTFWPTAEL